MTSGKAEKVDELLKKAEGLLAKGDLFAAETTAAKALSTARGTRRFDRMVTAAHVLAAARRGRLEEAMAVGSVTIVDEGIDEKLATTAGCYLIQPPLVGADARRLRLAALETATPVAVVCREPITQLRMCPIVAICPGTTVRTQIDPPDDLEAPDMEWFAGALQQLGDWALATLDPDLEVVRRIDALIDRLNAVPEHDGLHEALAAACQEAHDSGCADEDAEGTGSGRRSPARST